MPLVKWRLLKGALKGDLERGAKKFIEALFNLQEIAAKGNGSEEVRIELLFHSMQLITVCLLSPEDPDIDRTSEHLRGILSAESFKQKRFTWLKALLMPNTARVSFAKEASTWLFRICVLEKNTSTLLGVFRRSTRLN